MKVRHYGITDYETSPRNCVTTITGKKEAGFVDGSFEDALFLHPFALAMDKHGDIFVADQGNHAIRKIIFSEGRQKRRVQTITGSKQGYLDGAFEYALFEKPCGLAIDAEGNLYVSDSTNARVRKLDFSTRQVTTVVGCDYHERATFPSSDPLKFRLSSPSGLVFDKDGNLIISDSGERLIVKLNVKENTISVVEGSGFQCPHGLAVDTEGNIFVADSCKVKVIHSSGLVEVVAGTSTGFCEGSPRTCQFYFLRGLTVDSNNNLYIADSIDERIRVLSLTTKDFVGTVCGTGIGGYIDGPAEESRVWNPTHLLVDQDDNLIFADCRNNCIRKLTFRTMPWRIQRILWIAKLKNTSEECCLARLPKDMLIEVMRHC